jgi:TDG/mug DNA glycosylase family protein
LVRESRPNRAQLEAAAGKTVPDILTPGLKVVFCGINPGLYSAAIGHHFGRPGNRFWPAIYLAGFTPRQLSPYEEQELLGYSCGITNFVRRASANAAELSQDELRLGGQDLRQRIEQFQPCCLAVLGVTAYRTAFNRPKAEIGRQEEKIGITILWVLPNPSGLNAHYTLEGLADLFRQMRQALEGICL